MIKIFLNALLLTWMCHPLMATEQRPEKPDIHQNQETHRPETPLGDPRIPRIVRQIGEAMELEPSSPAEILRDLQNGNLRYGSERLEDWTDNQRKTLVDILQIVARGTFTNDTFVGILACQKIACQLRKINLFDNVHCNENQIKLQITYIQNSDFLDRYQHGFLGQTRLN